MDYSNRLLDCLLFFFVREELFDEVNDGLNPFSIKLRQYNSQNNIDFCATLL